LGLHLGELHLVVGFSLVAFHDLLSHLGAVLGDLEELGGQVFTLRLDERIGFFKHLALVLVLLRDFFFPFKF
jgi:hypothetical protein